MSVRRTLKKDMPSFITQGTYPCYCKRQKLLAYPEDFRIRGEARQYNDLMHSVTLMIVIILHQTTGSPDRRTHRIMNYNSIRIR